MPLLFAIGDKQEPDITSVWQLYIEADPFIPAGSEPSGLFLGDPLPELFEGVWLTLIGVFHPCCFETADNAIADGKDLLNECIVGEPAVKQDKGGIDTVGPGAADHLYQSIGLSSESFFSAAPAIGSLINLSDSLVRSCARDMTRHIKGEEVNSIMIA